MQQLLYDLRVGGSRLMDGCPHRRSESRPLIHVSRLERHSAAHQQADRLQLAPIHRPVQGIQPRPGTCRWIDAVCQEVLSNGDLAEKARARERLGPYIRQSDEGAALFPEQNQRSLALERGGKAREITVAQTGDKVLKDSALGPLQVEAFSAVIMTAFTP